MDCQSFTRHLLKAGIIQVLQRTREAKPSTAQLISVSQIVSLGLGLWVRTPPFTCMALAVNHSKPWLLRRSLAL